MPSFTVAGNYPPDETQHEIVGCGISGRQFQDQLFYSAEERVDFRELIKCWPENSGCVWKFKSGLRQEAGRLGGIGVCGRELCCSTWLSSFRNVATSAARYQNLSLNPSKLSGQCGRLKCCLNFELETYMDALKHIPDINKPIQTERGDASLQKTDIFRRIMWFWFQGRKLVSPVGRSRERNFALNAEGKNPATWNRMSW